MRDRELSDDGRPCLSVFNVAGICLSGPMICRQQR